MIVTPSAVVGLVDDGLVGAYLHKVEIQRLVGHNDALEALIGCRCAEADIVPRHDDGLHGVLAAPVAEKFVPHHEVLAVLLLHIDAQLLNEPGLQFLYATEAFLSHAAQAVLVGGPLTGGTFVAANVYVGIGEYLSQIVEHVFQEGDDLVVAHVENVVGDTAVNAHAVRLVGVAAEFGVGSHCGHHVTGKVYLGEDFDVARLSIVHHFLEVFLGVVVAAAVLCIVEELGAIAGAGERACAHGTHFCESGILGHVNAPALVVGQVPVEAVHLIERHHVEHTLHLFLVEEVAGDVHHESAVTKHGLVGDVHKRHGPLGTLHLSAGKELARQELFERLERIEEAGLRRGCHVDAVVAHNECIALGGQGVVVSKLEDVAVHLSLGEVKFCTRGCLPLCSELLSMGQAVHIGIGQRGDGGKVESTLFGHFKVLRIGHDGQIGSAIEGLLCGEAHSVVLVAFVPETHTAIFRRTSPEVHRNGTAVVGLNFVAAGIAAVGGRHNLVTRHTAGRSRGRNLVVLLTGGSVERKAFFVGDGVAVGVVACEFPQLGCVAHGCTGGDFRTLCVGCNGIASIHKLNEVPLLVAFGACLGLTVGPSAQCAEKQRHQESQEVFAHSKMYS